MRKNPKGFRKEIKTHDKQTNRKLVVIYWANINLQNDVALLHRT